MSAQLFSILIWCLGIIGTVGVAIVGFLIKVVVENTKAVNAINITLATNNERAIADKATTTRRNRYITIQLVNHEKWLHKHDNDINSINKFIQHENI